MALHAAADPVLHQGDAHRHFFPVSDWRLHSPISYWNPAHHGRYFLGFEILLVAVGSALLAKRQRGSAPRSFLAVLVAGYSLHLGYALLVWG